MALESRVGTDCQPSIAKRLAEFTRTTVGIVETLRCRFWLNLYCGPTTYHVPSLSSVKL